MKTLRVLLCITGVLISAATARANVYATDIRLNGSLYSVTNATVAPVTITYRLNEMADLGVTVAVMQGTNQVATIAGGTNTGLNTVVWGGTNNAGNIVGGGVYSFDISTAASGFTNWAQISVDTNAGNYAAAPNGLAVNGNTNSPFYGRVVLGCSEEGGVNPISGATNLDGIYKLNADGSFADEGGFGFGAYTNDDAGHTASHPGEMPSASTVIPWRLRIGDDDRIYMLDFSGTGAIIAFDMLMTSNQVVIDDGGKEGGHLGGPHNYSGNPDIGDLFYGINNFDVTSTSTANAAIWLCNYDSPANWGIWMYHLKNGASDSADTNGTQAVTTGGDLNNNSAGGCMVDANLDIFCAQSIATESPVYYDMDFAHWNSGVLPPEKGGTNYTLGAHSGQVLWGYGCGVNTNCGNDPTFEAIQDVVINSRTSPTIVACPTGAGNDDSAGSGIRLLNAANGSIVTVTNGSGGVIQMLTNLDFGQVYTCAAWDNVGNLYGASTSRNVWRVWSPPGTNTNTTVAVAQVTLTTPPNITITGITASPTGGGCANVTITFTSSASLAPSAFTVVSSSTVNGMYSAVSGAVITGSAGSYQATFLNCSTEFYEIVPTPPLTITGITASPTSPGCANVTITFTSSASVAPSAFTVVGSSTVNGTYSAVSGAVITGSAGSYQATFSNCSTEFYEIEMP